MTSRPLTPKDELNVSDQPAVVSEPPAADPTSTPEMMTPEQRVALLRQRRLQILEESGLPNDMTDEPDLTNRRCC